MTEPVFVDTNILVYTRDAADPKRQGRAREWMKLLWKERRGRVSAQVLDELYVTVTRKLRPGLDPETARVFVRTLFAWDPIPIDSKLLDNAWTVEDRFSISFWDALVVSAAQLGGCATLLTEDLQDGQDLDGVRIVNPFLHDPA
jgi:predicted nucleic acid-binding protein